MPVNTNCFVNTKCIPENTSHVSIASVNMSTIEGADKLTLNQNDGLIINVQICNMKGDEAFLDKSDNCEISKQEMKDENVANHEATKGNNTNVYHKKKYFGIWKTKALNNPKNSVENVEQITDTHITNFVNELDKKRKLTAAKATSSKSTNSKNVHVNCGKSEIFENRYIAQRDIILMQKSKLLEQERLIQELQFGKISEELQNSYDSRQNSIKKLLSKLSARTKVVAGVKIVEEPETIQMKINRAPKLVKQMEERAQERQLKRQIIHERKRLIDEEKQRLMKEQMERKQTQDEEERKRQVAAIKERRRREVEEEKRKQLAKTVFIHKCKTADLFHKKSLMKRGLRAFQMLIVLREDMELMSQLFYDAHLVKTYFCTWKAEVQKEQNAKMQKAVKFYDDKLKRRSLNAFQTMRVKAIQNWQVSVDYYNYQVQYKIMRAFYLVVSTIKIWRYKRMRIADAHYKNRLLVQSFYQWKSLPAVLQLERAKEEKRRKWREKVKEILPDYEPPILED